LFDAAALRVHDHAKSRAGASVLTIEHAIAVSIRRQIQAEDGPTVCAAPGCSHAIKVTIRAKDHSPVGTDPGSARGEMGERRQSAVALQPIHRSSIRATRNFAASLT
jgi:hypothetical protein